jgi:thiamine-phosphate pyrophosphorylase
MSRRQSMPEQWFILDRAPAKKAWEVLRGLPSASGLLMLCDLGSADSRRVRNIAKLRRLQIVVERPRVAARVHNVSDLRYALLRRTPLILLSPLYPTQSHPDWTPLPRMRAASLARLAHRRLVALGGMNAQRYARTAPLGFIGWAGISAFRT